MIDSSPFLSHKNQITCNNSSDYIMALSYIAKYYNDNTTLEDLLYVFKQFRVKSDYDTSILKKYVMNVKYSELTTFEKTIISSFFKVQNGLCLDFEEIIHQFSVFNTNSIISLLELAYCFDILYYRNNHYNYINYESVFNLIFKNNKDFNIYQNYKRLIKSIHMICEDYYEDLLEEYILDNDLLDILQMLEIEYFKDLSKFNDDILLLLFSRNIEEYITFFDKLKKRKREPISDIIDLIQEIKLKVFKLHQYQEIFYQRFGVLCEKKTLEEIGSKYGVTRELIRQKADRSIKKIKERYSCKFEQAVYKSLRLLKLNKNYIEFDKVKKLIDDDEVSYLLRALVEIVDFDITFDNEYQIFYYKKKKKDIEESRLIFIPYFISNDELNEYKGIDYAIITNSGYYKKYKNKGYLKSNYSTKDLYSSVIEELFINGFRINEETLEIINHEMQKKYGMEEINLRTFAGIIDRGEYCNIDRGIFTCTKYIVSLTDELIDEILTFISKNETEIIYYSTIYETFQIKLNSIGISNRYYLKGVLDRVIPTDYTPQRDFISIGNTFRSASDIINDYISSINGEFSIKALEEKFPGVADWVFINQINQRDDVLQNDYGCNYYKINYSCINEEFLNILSKEINELFISMKSPVITSTKIFSKMIIFHSELMLKYPFINNHYILYSLLTKKFKGKYFFRRPYISNNECINLSAESIISNYISSLDYFNSKIIDSFCKKMHLRNLYSYLDFIIDKSDEFISIDIDNCIKKEKVCINKKDIDKIQYELDYYINSFGPISTKKYNDYSSFPTINYPWTKYLLVGIIRAYLNNFYTIEYTDNSYNTTDFIIRRNKSNE